ncbi:MAG: transposase domain-containing protein [Planctomycetota bacterium]
MTAALAYQPRRDAIDPAKLDWSRLVLVEEAAQRLSLSRTSVTRRCHDPGGWADQLLAHYAQRPGDGQPKWWIDRRADDRLAATATPIPEAEDKLRRAGFYGYAEAARRRAYRRLDCVRALRHARANDARDVADWLLGLIERLTAEHKPHGVKVSRSALYEWDKKAGGLNDPLAPMRLLDRRGGDVRSQGDPAAWDRFRAIYLDDKRPSVQLCWRQTEAWCRRQTPPVAWCSIASCRRQLDTRVDPQAAIMHREPMRWRQTMAPTIEQDPERYAAGECWVGDQAILDLWCRLGASDAVIRPTLTAWQDWRTRRIVGWSLAPQGNAATIMAALRVGLEDEANHGGPAHVHVDNGKDYDAQVFDGRTKTARLAKRTVALDEPTTQGVFAALDIECSFSLAYNPNGKARMERWFRTLHETFDIGFVSYAGGSPARKPESLDAVLKRPASLPTFEQVEDELADFIAAYNARADHAIEDLVDRDEQTGERVTISPDEAMSRWCPSVRHRDPSAIQHLCRMWHPPVSVGKQGVTLRLYGRVLRYGAFDAALSPYKARRRGKATKVLVSYDVDDLATVQVWTLDRRFIAECRLNERGGGDARALKAVSRQLREYRRAMRFITDHRELEYLQAAELMDAEHHRRGLAERPAPPTPDPDAPLRLVQTAIEPPRNAPSTEPMRQAVGGEFDASGGGDASDADALRSLIFRDGPDDVDAPDEGEGIDLAASLDGDGDGFGDAPDEAEDEGPGLIFQREPDGGTVAPEDSGTDVSILRRLTP